MVRNRENIRIINIDAIIVLAVLFFGVLIHNNSFNSVTPHKSNPVSTYISVNGNNAVSSQCIRLQVFQKTWILNKDNNNLLAFNRNPFSENRKTDIKISQLQVIRQSSNRIPQFILRYHLYPSEPDEYPFLS
jgi:hypothetical protein